MHGGAVSLAKQFNELSYTPDLILASSMLDLTTFLALTRERSTRIPVAMYFHENQLTYPWSPEDQDVAEKRDNHYSFINYTSALSADELWFNSAYHKDSLLKALPKFLQQFPDKQGTENVEIIRDKSKVVPLGLDLARFETYRDSEKQKYSNPLIVWNHRWEYDKNPQEFFETLFTLRERVIDFNLVVLGERTGKYPAIFDQAASLLKEQIVHWGYAESFEEYARWLWKADILPVTSNQDFFGGSVVEAIYCDCFPILPNRLAYPEHIPKEIRRDYLYEEGELEFRLEAAIENVMMLRQVDYQSMVKKYDWDEQIDQYDSNFIRLIGSY